MRSEEIISKALEKVDDDRYKLCNLVFARVKELSLGATPRIDVDVKTKKLPDIALQEIAEGKISIERIEGDK